MAAPGMKNPRRRVMIAAGLLALVGGLIAGIVIIIKNKDGSERKIDVPDGSEVVIKQTDKDKKTDKVENPPTGETANDSSPAGRRTASLPSALRSATRRDAPQVDRWHN